MKRKTNPTHQLTRKDLMQDTTNTDLWKRSEFGTMCVLLETKKSKQNLDVQTMVGGCVLVNVASCITPNSIYEDCFTPNWRINYVFNSTCLYEITGLRRYGCYKGVQEDMYI
jgi:hypothetical protein